MDKKKKKRVVILRKITPIPLTFLSYRPAQKFRRHRKLKKHY